MDDNGPWLKNISGVRSDSMSMMAAAPPFASHPGAMAGHAGMAPGGHPMAQGHPSHQGIPGGGQQPGMAMGQQMHGGVMVPGGQQGHGMMGSMMPGGGPAGTSGNGGPSMQAHALSHLAPGHAYAQQQTSESTKIS